MQVTCHETRTTVAVTLNSKTESLKEFMDAPRQVYSYTLIQ